jgi:ABC-type multidrug transport system ATPase subunit
MKPQFESIKFEQLCFSHEGQDPVLYNADFDFPTRQIVWLKAEEGAGKSSLLQVMAGLQIPQSGKYLINGENVVEMSFEEFLPYRLQIGYSFDYGGLINNRSLFDNLMLPLLYHKILSGEEAKARVNHLLEKFEIKKFSHERPAHVPGRVRKLTCLARALVTHPQVLLLDDPSVGIGQEASYAFADYIHALRKEGSLQHIFISSYDEKFMGLFDYHLVHLSEGQLYFQAVDPEKRAAHL